MEIADYLISRILEKILKSKETEIQKWGLEFEIIRERMGKYRISQKEI